MAKKNKWYTSKGGWLGALIGFSYQIYSFSNRGIPCPSTGELVCSQDIFNKIIFGIGHSLRTTSPEALKFPPIYSTLVIIIIGFIIGYFIQKKFFKRRR